MNTEPVTAARIAKIEAGYRAYPRHFHPDERTLTAIRDLLARVAQDKERIDALTAQVAELRDGLAAAFQGWVYYLKNPTELLGAEDAIAAKIQSARELYDKTAADYAGKIVVSAADWERREKALERAHALFSAMPEASLHSDRKDSTWALWTEGMNVLRAALQPAATAAERKD